MEIGCVLLLGSLQDLPGQQRGEAAPGTSFAAFPIPKIQHPEPRRVFAWALGHHPRSKRWPLAQSLARLCGEATPALPREPPPGANRLVYTGETCEPHVELGPERSCRQSRRLHSKDCLGRKTLTPDSITAI